MARMYSAVIDQITVSAAQDLFELDTGAPVKAILHSIRLGQSSDAGDAQAEMLPIRIRRATVAGSGGTIVTPRPLNPTDPVSDLTVDRNNTTAAAGTLIELVSDTFNIQAGWLYLPTPEERIVMGVDDLLAVNLPATPADALTVSATIVWEEV